MVQPNVYALTLRDLAYNTIQKKLDAIGLLYWWATTVPPSLEARIEGGTLYSESEVNGSLAHFLRLKRNRGALTDEAVSRDVFNTRLLYIAQYLRWITSNKIQRLSHRDGKLPVLRESQSILLRWLKDLEITGSAENEKPKHLNNFQRDILESAILPGSSSNPWKSDFVRARNALMISIMLEVGIRPAELLNMEVSDVVIGAISEIRIVRRPNNPKDPRRQPPEVKRNGRVLIITPKLALMIDEYIVLRGSADDRHKTGTDFLILGENGNPLSYDALSTAFTTLRAKHPKLPPDFSAKTLRHTFSCEMEFAMKAAGIPEDRRMAILMILRGDTSLESQKVYTQAAIRFEAAKWLTDRQRLFEDLPY